MSALTTQAEEGALEAEEQAAWRALTEAEKREWVEQAAVMLFSDEKEAEWLSEHPGTTPQQLRERCDAAWAELAAPAKEAYVAAAAKTWRGTYKSSVDIFDFSERKCMKCAADVVTHIGGVKRPQPLLMVEIMVGRRCLARMAAGMCLACK